MKGTKNGVRVMKGKSQKGVRILILVQFNFDRITEAQMCKNKDIRKRKFSYPHLY